MSQFHLHATPEQLAPLVLLPGDPNRAAMIAETFFERPERYNSNRGLLGYTGRYQGMRVSVQTTGMGCPSLAIVVEELATLGARVLVRVGTAGIISSAVKPGELVIAQAAVPMDGTTRMYLSGAPYAPSASYRVTRALADAAERLGARNHVGLIQTEDAFYVTQPGDVARLERLGVLAVEMEASALFLLGKLRRFEAGTILVASNYIGDPQVVAREVLERAVATMVEVALEAGLHLQEEGS